MEPHLHHHASLSSLSSHPPSHLQASHLTLPPQNSLHEPSDSEHRSALSCHTTLPPPQSSATRHPDGASNNLHPHSLPYPERRPISQSTAPPTSTLAPNANEMGRNRPSYMSFQSEAAGSARPRVPPAPLTHFPLGSSPPTTAGPDHEERLTALRQYKQKQLLLMQVRSAKAKADEVYSEQELEESTILLETLRQGMTFDHDTGFRAALAIKNTVAAEKEVIRREIEGRELERQILYEKLHELEARVVDADNQLTYMQSLGPKFAPSQ